MLVLWITNWLTFDLLIFLNAKISSFFPLNSRNSPRTYLLFFSSNLHVSNRDLTLDIEKTNSHHKKLKHTNASIYGDKSIVLINWQENCIHLLKFENIIGKKRLEERRHNRPIPHWSSAENKIKLLLHRFLHIFLSTLKCTFNPTRKPAPMLWL